jgi:hypothetical protein
MAGLLITRSGRAHRTLLSPSAQACRSSASLVSGGFRSTAADIAVSSATSLTSAGLRHRSHSLARCPPAAQPDEERGNSAKPRHSNAPSRPAR